MALTITKKKSIQAVVVDSETYEQYQLQLIEYGDAATHLAKLEDILAKDIKDRVQNIKEIKAQQVNRAKYLIDYVDTTCKAEDSKVLTAGKYSVKIGKKAKVSKIVSPEKVQELLDRVQSGLFIKLAKVTLGDLGKYLGKLEYDQIVSETDDGKRTFKLQGD